MTDYTDFLVWLAVETRMSQRSAKDVVSRCKRVCKILGIDKINSDSTKMLLQNGEYKASSMFVKSQLKRATVLFTKFEEDK